MPTPATRYRRRSRAWPRLALCACALLGGAAQARDGGEEAPAASWTVGGFGTVGVAHSNQRAADYTGSYLNPAGAGYSRAWSPDVDTRLGLQVDTRLAPSWSATVQLVAERNLDGGYRPDVEWAYVKYQATPDLSLRLGRAAIPLFLSGDYRKAGYALPWVRPPVELYDAIPIGRSDGLDLSYRWRALGMSQHSQLLLGHTSVSLGSGKRADGRHGVGLSHTLTWDKLTVRASVLSSQLSVDIMDDLFAALRTFGPQGETLAARYEIRAKRATMAALGFSYDPGAWFLMGEVGHLTANSMLGDKLAGYLSAGYRYRNLTPYLTVSASRAQMETGTPGLDLGGLPAARVAVGAALNAGLNQALSGITRQHTVAAGVRWDWHSNMALKLQYDRVTPHAGSTGTFINVQPQFQSGRPVGVVSAALDFVF
jgi:opacity protein-like surface antigen